jgi:hypothetical protein
MEPIILKDEERTPCEVWSRVMGYYRPVDNWNIGKKQEFADRKLYQLPKSKVEPPPLQDAAS